MEPHGPTPGCLIVGSITAFLLLLAGTAVPLAGGTAFGGFPRILGTLVVITVWFVAVVSASRHRAWDWLVALVVFSPLALVLYGTNVSEDFTFPDAWSEFDSPPWYLIALMLSPVVLIAYGLSRIVRDDA